MNYFVFNKITNFTTRIDINEADYEKCNNILTPILENKTDQKE